MALTLTLDYNLRVINEPGFRRYFSARELSDQGQIGDPTDTSVPYRDPVTGTLFLYPLNLRHDWINTQAQIPFPNDPGNAANSVIRLSQQVIHPSDATARTIFEEKGFGNAANLFVHHSPVGHPGTPTFAPEMPAPGAGPPVTGAPIGSAVGTGLLTIPNELEIPLITYTGETPAGSVSSGKVLSYTKEKLSANQALMFRWFHPNPKIGHMTAYGFYFGQLFLLITGNLVTLYEDISAGGDRSNFRRLYSEALFSARDYSLAAPIAPFGVNIPGEVGEHDRFVFLLPYFRRRLLVITSNGTVRSWVIRASEERIGDGSDWKITRSDTAAVWVLTPAPGRYQIQKARYDDGPVTFEVPPIAVDYIGTLPATLVLSEDSDHATSFSFVLSKPAAYTMRNNSLTVCPPPVTAANNRTETHGVRVTMNGESTHRWTPFFYGLDFRVPRNYRDWSTLKTALTIGSTHSPNSAPTNSYLQSAEVVIGEKPGDGRMEAVLLDHPTLDLTAYYQRSDLPVRMTLDGVPAFTGWTRELHVLPFAEGNEPREIRVRAVDRWRQLSDRRKQIRDNRDWSGVGHIDVVLAMLEEAGVEASFVEHPPKTSSTNTPLGALKSRLSTDTGTLQSGWKPRPDDSPAEFISRIANNFSGWRYGFRPDGTFYYLPVDWFTSTTVTMYPDEQAAIAGGNPTAPIYQNPVPFRTEGPAANVVQVVARDGETGTLAYSSRFIDWASLLNGNAANFVGDMRVFIQELPGVFACDELNRMAQVILKKTRLRRRLVSFTAPFLPGLKIGQIVSLIGYGTFRLLEMAATLVYDTWNPATYTGEAIESGY